MAYLVSDEKSPVNFIEDLWCVMSHFSLAAFKNLSVFQQFDYEGYRYESSGVYPSWNSLHLLDVQIKFFPKIGQIFSHYFFQYLFCSFVSALFFWDFHYSYVGSLDGVPQISEALLIFIHSFFFIFLKLNNLKILSFIQP